LFLHFGSKKSCSRLALGMPERICLDGTRRVAQQRAKDKHGKCGQICGGIHRRFSTLNNRLIFNVYFCHTCPAIACCGRRGAKLDAAGRSDAND
jgi:hypothetical protein